MCVCVCVCVCVCLSSAFNLMAITKEPPSETKISYTDITYIHIHIHTHTHTQRHSDIRHATDSVVRKQLHTR